MRRASDLVLRDPGQSIRNSAALGRSPPVCADYSKRGIGGPSWIEGGTNLPICAVVDWVDVD